MSEIALESEDLENVPLVRMEDVQPSRDRVYEASRRISSEDSDEEVLETCVIEDIEYDEYIVNNDDDSNIGSMVSIKSEEAPDDSDAEMIIPDFVGEITTEDVFEKEQPDYEKNNPLCVYDDSFNLEETRIPETEDRIEQSIEKPKSEFEQRAPESSWPTLEILPGGVIRKPEHSTIDDFDDECEEVGMMYACAKCPQRFKYLFCLVRHVKWHEDEAKKFKRNVQVISKTSCTSQSTCTHNKQLAKKKKDRKLMLIVKGNKKKLKDLKS